MLGLDEKGHVTIANSSALRLLGMESDALLGLPLAVAVPEFGELLQGHGSEIKPWSQVEVKRLINGEERTFSVRLTIQGAKPGEGAADAAVADAVNALGDFIVDVAGREDGSIVTDGPRFVEQTATFPWNSRPRECRV